MFLKCQYNFVPSLLSFLRTSVSFRKSNQEFSISSCQEKKQEIKLRKTINNKNVSEIKRSDHAHYAKQKIICAHIIFV